MTRIKAHFDGKVIVPDEPIDLPADTRLIITVAPAETNGTLAHGTVGFIQEHMKGRELADDEADLMKAMIEEHCERIDPDPNVDLDAVPDGHECRDRSDEKV